MREEIQRYGGIAKFILTIALSCLIGAILAAVTAVIVLRFVSDTPPGQYDDTEEILADYRPEYFRGASIADDGSITVRLDKPALYWYANEYGLLRRFEEKTAQLPDNWVLHKYGYTLGDNSVTLFIRASRGFLPRSFQAEYEVSCEGTVLSLRPLRVHTGGFLTLKPERWPSFLPAEGFRIDLSRSGISDSLTGVQIKNGCLVLETSGLGGSLSGRLEIKASIQDALRAYGCEKIDTWGILSWVSEQEDPSFDAAEVRDEIIATGHATEALADLLACCTGSSRQSMMSRWDRFTLEFAAVLVEQNAQNRREELSRYFAAEQGKYEKLLTASRELYKSGALRLCYKGFENLITGEHFDPAVLTSSLSPTALDSRLLLLSSSGGATGVRTTDMPSLGRIPRTNDRIISDMDPYTIYDLGLMMTTESGMPALLYYRNDGVFVIRELDMDLYIQLLVTQRVPVLNVDSLELPETRTALRTVAGMNSYEIILLED